MRCNEMLEVIEISHKHYIHYSLSINYLPLPSNSIIIICYQISPPPRRRDSPRCAPPCPRAPSALSTATSKCATRSSPSSKKTTSRVQTKGSNSFGTTWRRGRRTRYILNGRNRRRSGGRIMISGWRSMGSRRRRWCCI